MFATDATMVTATPIEPKRATRGGQAGAGELAGRLAYLAACSYDDLRAEWRRVYRSHPPKKISRDLLQLGVAWKLQEKVLGGLGPALKRRLAGLAETMVTEGDLAKARAVTLRPGARLVREWHGAVHEILVLDDSFQWRGERWRSLTAIAHAITGTHWSGPRFFGLAGSGRVGRPVPDDASPVEADLGDDGGVDGSIGGNTRPDGTVLVDAGPANRHGGAGPRPRGVRSARPNGTAGSGAADIGVLAPMEAAAHG